MAKNNKQNNNSHSNKQSSRHHTGKPPNKQPSVKPTGKPSKCTICDKLHNGECRYKNPSTKPISNCSYCGKKGHDESVCRMKNTISTCSHCGKKGHDESVCRMKPKPAPSPSAMEWPGFVSVYDIDMKRLQCNGRWAIPMYFQRERDHSEVSFPLTLVGGFGKSPQETYLRGNFWLEDSDNDAIMCLHDCRENFCFERFADKCASQPALGAILVSQSDEAAIRQTMTNNGIPNSGFGNSLWT